MARVLRGAGGGAARRPRVAAPPGARGPRPGPLPPRSRPGRDRAARRSSSTRAPRSAWRSWTSGSPPASATSTSPRWRSRAAWTRSLRSPTWIPAPGVDLWRTASELLRRNLGPGAAEDRRRTGWPSTTVPAGPCRVCGTAIAVRRQGEAARVHLVVSHLPIDGRRPRPMARSPRRPSAEDRTCNTARRGTPCRRRAVGDRDPSYRWPRRPARSRSSGEATPWTRRSRRPSRSPSATRTTAAWAATCSRWCSGRTAPRSPSTPAGGRPPPSIPTPSARDTARHARAGSRLHHGPGCGQRLGRAARGGCRAAVARCVRPGDRARARRRRRLPIALARAARNANRLLAVDPGMAEVFFQDGAPLARGALFRQPALGATLQQLAAEGPGALYGGAIGERYVDGLARDGLADHS